ncbi:hypothetical protein H072_8185 [Dactylellina haptotyla CBS 200.50]|uniref:B30.2/SPRY domain-containing protein n=1 Tax=Dactylellina haptotyla (strain CBS 200.50) TaxID=1284197 RepID=S8BFM4_DACHA|nr:hypothetical protein H072_8185 [Dactylellina haptotyla CBS 200.50]
MKRSLSRDPEPRIESPAPGAHHATPVAGSPEPGLAAAAPTGNRLVKTKPRDKVAPREGGREKKESWKKKEAQAAARAATPTSVPATASASKGPSAKAAAAAAAAAPNAKNAPPALQMFTLPPPKDVDYLAAKGPILVPVAYPKNSPTTTFYETTEQSVLALLPPAYAVAHPLWKVPPFAARISYEDKSTHIHIDQSGVAITTEKGFRSARANVGVREGDWYYECKIINGINPKNPAEENGHVRVGFGRRETSLDVPVGYDTYSYGIRDMDGQKVHTSRPKDFMRESFVTGDVIGLHISLPPISTQREILAPFSETSKYPPDVLRDRVPIKYKAQLYFEQFEYMPTKDMEDAMNPAPSANTSVSLTNANKSSKACFKTLPNSKIRVYKNGKYMGTAFENLYVFLPPASQPLSTIGGRPLDDGFCGYYPIVSVFRGGRAQANFGPQWECPPEDLEFGNDENPSIFINGDEMRDDEVGQAKISARPLSERYDEQIAEDVTYDIVDEVDMWFTEQKAAETASNDAGGATGAMGNGLNTKQETKEIQEMHIDEE